MFWLLFSVAVIYFRGDLVKLFKNSTIHYTFVVFSLWFVKMDFFINIRDDNNCNNFDKNFLKNKNFDNFLNLCDFFFYIDCYMYVYSYRLYKCIPVFVKLNQLDNNKFYKFQNFLSITYNSKYFIKYNFNKLWEHIKFWVLSLIVVVLVCYYLFFLKFLPFSKLMLGYFLLLSLVYLLLSGFVFFFKKYQYRLYTSAIQRFWRRTLIIFWLIEATTFATFFYLTINANQEPVYMYDNVQLYKTHFYSWRFFLVKIIPTTFIIIMLYMLLLSAKWNTFSKLNHIAFLVTIILFYVVWLEFYQLFHLLNHYGTLYWIYDIDEHLWNLEIEFRRTRIVNHYVTICLIAKFWHIIFVFVFWVFFLLRGLEIKRFRYSLLAANLQNFIVIYLMSWLYMYPWFKYSFKFMLNGTYFWFFLNNRNLGFFLFLNDMKLYFFGLFDVVFDVIYISDKFKNTPFYYWFEFISNKNIQFVKHNIRDTFIRSLC